MIFLDTKKRSFLFIFTFSLYAILFGESSFIYQDIDLFTDDYVYRVYPANQEILLDELTGSFKISDNQMYLYTFGKSEFRIFNLKTGDLEYQIATEENMAPIGADITNTGDLFYSLLSFLTFNSAFYRFNFDSKEITELNPHGESMESLVINPKEELFISSTENYPYFTLNIFNPDLELESKFDIMSPGSLTDSSREGFIYSSENKVYDYIWKDQNSIEVFNVPEPEELVSVIFDHVNDIYYFSTTIKDVDFNVYSYDLMEKKRLHLFSMKNHAPVLESIIPENTELLNIITGMGSDAGK